MRLFIYLYMKTPHPIAYPSTKALISPLILPHPSKKTAFGSPDLFVSLIFMRGSRVLERVKGSKGEGTRLGKIYKLLKFAS